MTCSDLERHEATATLNRKIIAPIFRKLAKGIKYKNNQFRKLAIRKICDCRLVEIWKFHLSKSRHLTFLKWDTDDTDLADFR